jgi:hypothetical protein
VGVREQKRLNTAAVDCFKCNYSALTLPEYIRVLEYYLVTEYSYDTKGNVVPTNVMKVSGGVRV